ncbi:putative pectinesterase/pectinesterase inhibitor 26 [Papaver somniferum]|uniref:putative pectinesterase/pectinesterase inhibitor 26 n=1 Tax=Papaver somniferum TaxID=3469 RepID=UPI000E70096E|nr:putative pectinesterase/pectinesterase inhibitor 26 [Papaver somniferum]
MDIAIPIINNNTSLKGHHHLKDNDKHDRRRTTNNLNYKIQFLKPLLIFIVAAAFLLSILITAAFGIGSLIIHNTKSTPSELTLDETMELLNLVCNVTHYPVSCKHSLYQEIVGPAVDNPARHYADGIFKLSLTVATRELQNMSSSIPAVAVNLKVNRRDERVKVEAALRDCRGLIEDAIDKIETSISSIDEKEEEYERDKKRLFMVSESKKMVNDIRGWVSAALTNTDTCLDGLEDVLDNDENSKILPEDLKIVMMNSKEYVTNCLGIVSNFDTVHKIINWNLHRNS